MDSIRGISFVPTVNALISASEDCTLKVWDVAKFNSLKEIEGVVNFEPYLTMRGHVSPILSLCGMDQQKNQPYDNLVISGSSNGQIKGWRIPSYTKIDSYGANKDQSFCLFTLDKAHEDQPIWDLKVH